QIKTEDRVEIQLCSFLICVFLRLSAALSLSVSSFFCVYLRFLFLLHFPLVCGSYNDGSQAVGKAANHGNANAPCRGGQLPEHQPAHRAVDRLRAEYRTVT